MVYLGLSRWANGLHSLFRKNRMYLLFRVNKFRNACCTFSNLKSLCPLFFIKLLFLTKWYLFKNYEKCFLFHLKSQIRSRGIQIFLFPSSPLFLTVSHCFRGWSKRNFKVHDIINCLNKNLITHFLWYHEKEKRYDIKTLSIDRVLNTKSFYGKIMQEIWNKG